jgi:hypothetical protein
MQIPRNISISASANSPSSQASFSFGSSGSRSVAQLGMNISNLKTSRGCSSCGK